jgi:hypothetical protein
VPGPGPGDDGAALLPVAAGDEVISITITSTTSPDPE